MISNCNETWRFRIYISDLHTPFLLWNFTFFLLLFYAIFCLISGFPSNSWCFEMKFLQYKILGKSKSGCVLERGDTELFRYGVRIRNKIKYILSKSKRSVPFFLVWKTTNSSMWCSAKSISHSILIKTPNSDTTKLNTWSQIYFSEWLVKPGMHQALS